MDQFPHFHTYVHGLNVTERQTLGIMLSRLQQALTAPPPVQVATAVPIQVAVPVLVQVTATAPVQTIATAAILEHQDPSPELSSSQAPSETASVGGHSSLQATPAAYIGPPRPSDDLSLPIIVRQAPLDDPFVVVEGSEPSGRGGTSFDED